MFACILTENEDVIADLRAKEEKKRKAEEKKKATQEKKQAAMEKKAAAGKAAEPRQKPTRPAPEPQESSTDEDEEQDLPMLLEDSSDFEEDFGEEEDLTDGSYPFVDKEAEVRVHVFLSLGYLNFLT